MIFVSSFRPREDCPDDIWEHQRVANHSWNRIADKIIYFNPSHPEMASSKTIFIPVQYRPTIREMAAFCGRLTDWSALVNADIYVSQGFRRAERQLRDDAWCAVSRRYNFTPSTTAQLSLAQAKVIDNGIDFFAATPKAWQKAAEAIGPEYTFGRIVWDNWMVNFFMSRFGNYCWDLTPARCIFHPQHEARRDQNWEFNKKDDILRKNNWPFHAVTAVGEPQND